MNELREKLIAGLARNLRLQAETHSGYADTRGEMFILACIPLAYGIDDAQRPA